MKIPVLSDRKLSTNLLTINGVESSMREIISQCQKKLLELFPNASLYLYGGIAQGKKSSKFSDLDLMLIFSHELNELEIKKIKKMEISLTQQYNNTFAYVGIETVTPLLYRLEQNLVYALLVKSLGIHLGGPSFHGELSEVYLNKELGFQLNSDFESRIVKKYNDLKNMESDHEKLLACRWIMKKLLRTSFSLIIDKIDYFENDIHGLVKTLSDYYPAQKKEITQIGFLIDNPSTQIHEIDQVLSNYFYWLKSERNKVYF